jgi:hypothetical protein
MFTAERIAPKVPEGSRRRAFSFLKRESPARERRGFAGAYRRAGQVTRPIWDDNSRNSGWVPTARGARGAPGSRLRRRRCLVPSTVANRAHRGASINEVTWKLTNGEMTNVPACHGFWGGY